MIKDVVSAKAWLLAVLAVGVFWGWWTWYTWPTVVKYVPSFAVSYQKGVGQEAVLEVVNGSGYPVPFCASIYGWLPNGSIIQLGHVCGEGRARLDVGQLRKYAGEWRELRGEVGVFTLLTYINGTGPRGNYTLARAVKSFTIQPQRVLGGENIKATIKVKGKPPAQKGGNKLSLQFPPSQIPSNCIYSDTYALCYYWELDRVYASATNTPIPVVVARVPTSWEASKIDFVDIYLAISASQQSYVYVSGGAAIVKRDTTVGFSADVYTITISDSSFQLSSSKAYSPDTQGPSVVAVGFYGDYALAGFKEKACSTAAGGATYCSYTDYYAYMYLMRPYTPPGSSQPVARSYAEVQPLGGWLDEIFKKVASNWDSRTKYGSNYVYVDSITVVQENGGIDILSLAVPIYEVKAWALSSVVQLGAGVGVSRQVVAVGKVSAGLITSDPRYYLVGIYYKPKVLFEYGGAYYPLPSLFVDVRVYSASGLGREAEN